MAAPRLMQPQALAEDASVGHTTIVQHIAGPLLRLVQWPDDEFVAALEVLIDAREVDDLIAALIDFKAHQIATTKES